MSKIEGSIFDGPIKVLENSVRRNSPADLSRQVLEYVRDHCHVHITKYCGNDYVIGIRRVRPLPDELK